MARYFMQLRGGVEDLLDPEGLELPSLAALQDAVLVTARDLLTTDVRLGVMDFRLRIDAEDEGGAIVHTLRLKHAVNITRARRRLTPLETCEGARILFRPSRWLFMSRATMS